MFRVFNVNLHIRSDSVVFALMPNEFRADKCILSHVECRPEVSEILRVLKQNFAGVALDPSLSSAARLVEPRDDDGVILGPIIFQICLLTAQHSALVGHLRRSFSIIYTDSLSFLTRRIRFCLSQSNFDIGSRFSRG